MSIKDNKTKLDIFVRNHADIAQFSQVLEEKFVRDETDIDQRTQKAREYSLIEFSNSLDVLDYISRNDNFYTDSGVLLADLEKLVQQEEFFKNSPHQNYTYSIIRKAINILIDSKIVSNMGDKMNIKLRLKPELMYLFVK
jgi:hypothetical protein